MSAPARLRALRMVGFKSFAEKTAVEFGAGISCVIGPNGSGKSNLADALRWALGEQGRSLRTRKAEDVIFAGSERRHAIGMADVTLDLDNSDGLIPVDFQEVSLGRRLFRSGENDYLVNRQRVRHRDLVELLESANLADNAFLFIGQGMVDQALALRPEERRPLFEEVAGVRRHERRRRHAEAQLAEAEANLARVRDLLGELRPQARRLAQQVEQEQARRSAADELATALVAAARARWVAARVGERSGTAEQAAAQRAVARVLDELRASEDQAAALSRSLAERAEAEQRLRVDLDEARAALTALQLSEARVDGALDALERDRARLEAERSSIEPRRSESQRVAARPVPEPDLDAEAALAAAERDLADAVAELARLRAAAQESGERAAALRRAVAARATDLEAARRRADELGRREREQEARREAANQAAAAAAARVGEAMTALADAIEREHAADANVSRERDLAEAAEGRRAARAERASALAARLASARGRLAALDQLIDDAENGAIVAAARRRGGQRVAEGLDVEPRLRVAVEASLGAALRSAALPADRIAALGEERGTLVVADAPGPRTPEREAGRAREAATAAGGGSLVDAVRRDPGGIAVRLLGGALWAPDRARALALQRMLPPGWSVATPAGELVTAAGLVSLGSVDSLLERRAEREGLATELDRLAAEAAAAQEESAAATVDAAAGREAVDAARQAAERARRDRRAAEEAERAAARLGESSAREQAWEAAQAERVAADATRAREALALLDGADAAGTMAALAAPETPGTTEHDAIRTWDERVRELRARRDRLAGAVEERGAERRRAEDARSRAEATLALDTARVAAIEQELRLLASTREDRVAERATVQAGLGAARERESSIRRALDELLAAGAGERERLAAAERGSAQARERLRAADERVRAAGVAEVEARIALDNVREQMLVELAGLGEAGLRAVRAAAGDGQPDASTASGVPGTDGDEVAPADLAPHAGPAADAGVGEPNDPAALIEAAVTAAFDSWDREEAAPGDGPGQSRLATLRRRYHELGASNPYAAEEYAEVRGRLDALETQREDLERAIRTTRELIENLDRLVTEQFRSTFRALEGAFERRFTRLFGGGYAKLSLTDPDNLDATGVEIIAQPPGKKRQPLAMLSGGERALTAVALLFAMLEVRPVPFCVLDEVDAALDEANIGRFAESLRELAEQTQCIVITHNRGTIESADALYGITLGDDAVSRVVSLRLEDARTLVERRRAERAEPGI